MNTIKKIFFVALLAGILIPGKAQKIAHLSLDSLMASMPETKTAKQIVQNLLKGYEAEVLSMQTELESKYKDYLEKKETMSQPVRQNKEQDLNQLQQRIEEFKNQAGVDVQKKQAELGAPILQKAKKGIEVVAKEAGYKYVLNTSLSNGGALYSEPSDDVFAAVKKKLDSMPLATLPGNGENTKTPVKPGLTPKKGK
jgi:outer membrane protein